MRLGDIQDDHGHPPGIYVPLAPGARLPGQLGIDSLDHGPQATPTHQVSHARMDTGVGITAVDRGQSAQELLRDALWWTALAERRQSLEQLPSDRRIALPHQAVYHDSGLDSAAHQEVEELRPRIGYLGDP